MLPPVFDAVASDLQAHARWVVWKDAKVPYDPGSLRTKANVNDPATWSTFSGARTAYDEGGYLGIGFVLNGDGIVGIDLDRCVDGGTPSVGALRLLEELNCGYVELSPSGTGLRGFGYGEPIAGRRGRVNGVDVEVYGNKRYLTVTGRRLKGTRLQELRGLSNLVQKMNGYLQKRTEEYRCNPQCSSVEPLLSSSVGAVPIHTLPTHVGERNRCLFEFARYLKGRMPGASISELRPHVQAWHALALPVIGTKDFAITFADFRHGWDRVRHPFGTTLVRVLSTIDPRHPLPESVTALGYGSSAEQLVRICTALQAHAGDKEFFLSARSAAEVLKIHFTDAAKLLRVLVEDGVLTLVSKGSGKKASRYRLTLTPGPT